MAGPFDDWPLENLIISPIGVVPKKEPGQYRLIQHLSWPEGASVNDFIGAESASVSYSSVDVAMSLVVKAGPLAQMAKCDIKSAFRLLPVHPEDWSLLGIHFHGKWYVDKALPLGCSISCALLALFYSGFYVHQSGHELVTHYLDDFFFVGPQGSSQCQAALDKFKELMEYLGVPLAPEKTMGPCATMSFLGIELDSRAMQARLPQDKKVKMLDLMQAMLAKPKVTVKEVQVLLGHLNFACRVVRAGRTFCRRLGRALSGHHLPHHRIRLTAGVKEDLRMWSTFLHSFNGIPLAQEQDWLWEVQIFSDAAGSDGFGLYWQGRWCAEKWPEQWRDGGRSIAFLELFPVLVALTLWGQDLAHKKVLFRIDNRAVVDIINRQSARDTQILKLLRVFVLGSLKLQGLTHSWCGQ
ncbi:uncharacterized protein LOC144755420 [Lissotriton helveticus]